MPREDVVRLLAQHPLLGSAPRTDLSLLHPERADDDPWDRLRTLGPLDGELRAFALQLAIKALAPVARAADRITERLRALDWPLRQTARRSAVAVSPITAPPDTMGVLDAEIREIERIAGCRVPVTLEAFWRVVGTIDWSPEPDEAVPPWAVDVGLETIDPLCVYGLDAALECMKEWSERRASAKHPELVLPPRLWLAPDRFHKMGISGGEPYEIVLDSCLDPKVENAPEDLCLVPYLENALRWGGMPGIARRKRLSDRTRAALETLTADLELH